MTQEQQMPSSTRFTVHVEGHGQTYWDNIHDAITYAQRAVYAGVANTTRALDDLKAGRIAEWSYGFSAVRIYPPQPTIPPQPKPEPDEAVQLRGEIRVLVGLLKEALQVIETVDGEDAEECNRLMELQNKMGYAILGASV